MNLHRVLPLLILAICLPRVCADEFETPAILKYNVAFWKKIYTEVTTKEGYLHDSEYPMVIYEKVTIGERSGRARAAFIKGKSARIEAMLSRLVSEPQSSWTEEEKAIAAMFAQHSAPEAMTGAAGRIRFQQGQKDRFYEGLYRSGAYLDTIRAILSQYNVPLKLAYLPHVESSFNPHAYSKVGAAGLWQFMRGTGRLYLKIDYLIDERRDPIAATYAAAKLLSHNYSELQSWPLAITAYNHGLYGMKRAVATTGSRDIAVIIERHQSRTFKFASKNFYGCFLAACDIAETPLKYFPQVEYAQPLRHQDVVLTHFIRPDVLAGYLNIDQMVLAEMNPAIRPVVFEQQKLIPRGTRIHLPSDRAPAEIELALAAIPDSLKLEAPPRPEYYRVRKGDNLYAIASRFRVSAGDLAQENGITRMNSIYAGQVLRVPGTAETAAEPIESFVEDRRSESHLVSRAPEPEPEPVEPAGEGEKVRAEPVEALPDSLEEIVMVEAEAAPIQPGGKARTGGESRFDADVYDLDVEIALVGNASSIRVTVDETIGHYAEWLDMPAWRIRQLNRMGNRSVIRTGQRLTIPGDEDKIARFVQKRLEYHMMLEEDFYNQYKVVELRERLISRGETLWDISCDDGEIPIWLIKKYNKQADLTRLSVGMKLWVPVVAEKTAEDFAREKVRLPDGAFPYYQEPVLPPARPVRRVP